MKTSIAEIADRCSILLHKIRNCNDIDNKTSITFEFREYMEEIYYFSKAYPEIFIYLIELYNINGEIWALESDIRKGHEKELGIDEVGRRSILIRDKNKQRISIKNRITEHFDIGHKEIKINHASDEQQ